MEIVGYIGSILAIIGWIWLIVTAFRNGGILWGLVVLIFSWIGGLIFCILKKKGWLQFAMMIVGLIIGGIGLAPSIMKMFSQQ